MKQVIIGSAIAVTLAAGVLIFWPASRSTTPEPKPAPPLSTASAPAAGGESKSVESHAEALPIAATGSFVERAGEIASTPPTTEREEAIRSLAREWAAEDFVAAERWAAAFEDPKDRDRAMTHVCLAMGGRNPREAIEMAQWHHLNQGTIESIIGQWAEADFEAAAGWVGELPEGSLRDNALARLALARAETSPAEAASLVSASLSAGSAQEEAAISVLYQWLRKDPEAAEQWVDAFPDGPLKDRARAEVQGMMAYRQELQAAQ